LGIESTVELCGAQENAQEKADEKNREYNDEAENSPILFL